MSIGERTFPGGTGPGLVMPDRRWLVVRGQHTALRVALPAFGVVSVGSGEAADVRVGEPGVAAKHAVLHFDPAIGVEIFDADSGVTKKKSRGEDSLDAGMTVSLELGDELRLGSVALSFVAESKDARAHRAWSRAYFEEKLPIGDPDAMLIRLKGTDELFAALDDHLEASDLLADLGNGELAILLRGAGESRARALARGPIAGRELGMIGLSEVAADHLDRAAERMSRAAAADRGPGIVIEDPAMQEVMRLVDQLAESSSPVLILGETGVGKGLVAQMIHDRSSRALRPFVRVSCVELADADSPESEGAPRLPALIARASGGTVLLDEVAGLSARAQIALNNVIEAKEVRFLATSNHDLRGDVKRGSFRKDLFFRLNRLTISIPPLRSRPAEIVPLAEYFLAKHAASSKRAKAPKLGFDAKDKLRAHTWPGNVRELDNAIERALLLARGDSIGADAFALESFDEDTEHPTTPSMPAAAPAPAAAAAAAGKPTAASLRDEMAALERARILQALEQYPTQADAAKALDIPLRTFLNRLDALGIPRPRKTKE